jgi:glucosamine-6-phosphate deaminase
MDLVILPTKQELGKAAATFAAERINAAIAARKGANIILATGASQFEMFASLVTQPVDWSRVTAFHLDEYVALPKEHRAGLGRYLKERFLAKLPRRLRAFHFIRGQGDPQAECRRIGGIIRKHPIDVAFVGIGENGHLAFNDPPVADFADPLDMKVVELDRDCRLQQVHEGHFPDFDAVPTSALTATIPALLRAGTVLAIVPEARKAEPVRAAVLGPVSIACPASFLRTRDNVTLHLEPRSASLLGW